MENLTNQAPQPSVSGGVKTSNVWHCNDCHKVGFYFDLTDEQIREKHALECENKESE